MRATLADGVFMTCCDEDVIVLDTRSDHYSCLPEAAAVLTVSADEVAGPQEVLVHLAAAGFTGATPGAPRPRLPLPASTALSMDDAHVTVGDEITVLRGMLAAWRHGPGRRPLSHLLAGDATVPGAPVDLVLVARLTAAFARRLPWDPFQGACLYRAWLLRRILASRGQSVTWVFGVRTWPFGAHCWLQIENLVLDDEPDRISQYTPIMAV